MSTTERKEQTFMDMINVYDLLDIMRTMEFTALSYKNKSNPYHGTVADMRAVIGNNWHSFPIDEQILRMAKTHGRDMYPYLLCTGLRRVLSEQYTGFMFTTCDTAGKRHTWALIRNEFETLYLTECPHSLKAQCGYDGPKLEKYSGLPICFYPPQEGLKIYRIVGIATAVMRILLEELAQTINALETDFVGDWLTTVRQHHQNSVKPIYSDNTDVVPIMDACSEPNEEKRFLAKQMERATIQDKLIDLSLQRPDLGKSEWKNVAVPHNIFVRKQHKPVSTRKKSSVPMVMSPVKSRKPESKIPMVTTPKKSLERITEVSLEEKDDV